MSPPDPNPNASVASHADEALKRFQALQGVADMGQGEEARNMVVQTSLKTAIGYARTRHNSEINVRSDNGQVSETYRVSDNGDIFKKNTDGSFEETASDNILKTPALPAADALMRQTLKDKARDLLDPKWKEILKAQEKIAYDFGKSADDTKSILKTVRTSESYKDAYDKLKPMIGDGRRAEDMTLYLWRLEQGARSILGNDAPPYFKNDKNLQAFAAATDIVSVMATGQPSNSMNDLTSTASLPKPKDLLFTEAFYEHTKFWAWGPDGKQDTQTVPAALLGGEYADAKYKDKVFTKAEVAVIAGERAEARAEALGIPKHKITEALFDIESGFSVSNDDSANDMGIWLYGKDTHGNGLTFNQAFNRDYGSILDIKGPIKTIVTDGHYMEKDANGNPKYSAAVASLTGEQIVDRLRGRIHEPGMSDAKIMQSWSAASYFSLTDQGPQGMQNLQRDMEAKRMLTYDETRRTAAGIHMVDVDKILKSAAEARDVAPTARNGMNGAANGVTTEPMLPGEEGTKRTNNPDLKPGENCDPVSTVAPEAGKTPPAVLFKPM